VATLALSGCAPFGGGAEAPSQEPTTAATSTKPAPEPKPIETAPPVPAEPYITTETLNSLSDENSPHFAIVENAKEAAAKGMNRYVIQNPNTVDVDLMTIDLPIGAEIQSVETFESVVDLSDGQVGLDSQGTVINLGANRIEQGDADANSPGIRLYMFDRAVTLEEFALSYAYPDIPWSQYFSTGSVEEFNKRFLSYKNGPSGLYTRVEWGQVETGPGGPGDGQDICQFLARKNDSRLIDPDQYNLPSADYGTGDVCQGAASIYQLPDRDSLVFATIEYVGRESASGWDSKTPNLNDPAVRNAVTQYVNNTDPHTVTSNVDGQYAILSPHP
jgi:hypothetical protein